MIKKSKRVKPKILGVELIAQSRLFKIEAVNLRFSNSVERQFERMRQSDGRAVMVVPIYGTDLLLIREYAVGIEDYELTFPKGLVDQGESPIVAANRELMEEVGFGARKLTTLHVVRIAPAYFGSAMSIVLAERLYPQTREGDEPEPPELIRWPIADMMGLLQQPDFTEARCISALFLAHSYLNDRERSAQHHA